KRLSEILYKASICKYTVDVPRTEPPTPPKFDVETSPQRPAIASPGLDSRPGIGNGNNFGLPTRGPRL
uniref:Uncharacterized protein n=1 Tax=Romanomermis culicivorax TaxID=13658 RepID=A0A915HJW9_ROMCU